MLTRGEIKIQNVVSTQFYSIIKSNPCKSSHHEVRLSIQCCLGVFLISLTKIWQKQLKTRKFPLAVWGQSLLWCGSDGCRNLCKHSQGIHSQEGDRTECYFSAHIVLLFQSRTPAHEWRCPRLGQSFSLQLAKLRNSIIDMPRGLIPLW